MERRSGRLDARSVNARGIERFGVHDVEAAASIHQHLGEPLVPMIESTMSGYLPGCGMLSGWSERSKVMADSDHRRKVGVAGLAI